MLLPVAAGRNDPATKFKKQLEVQITERRSDRRQARMAARPGSVIGFASVDVSAVTTGTTYT